MRLNTAVSVLFAVALCVTAQAAAAFTAGDKVQSTLKLAGKQVPLPSGEWVVAGASVQNVTLPEIGAYGAVRTVILAQVSQGKVAALAEVNANMIAVTDGWGQTASCAKGDQFLLVTRYRSGWDLSCFFINTTQLLDASGPDAWTNARAYLAKANLALPETALTVGFRASDRQDVIDLRLHFNPAMLPGLEAKDARTWTSDSVKANPAQRRAVEILSAWALGVDGWIDRGLGNQGFAKPVEGPQRAAILSDTPLTDRKLADLETLYNRGSINIASLREQEEQVLLERPFLVPETGGLSMSMRKNISFRVLGSAVDYILAYAVTLSGTVSAGITASIVAIHSVIFVVNDQYWDDFFARKTTRDSKRVIDFTYIGKPKA